MFRARDFRDEADLQLMQQVLVESWRTEKPLVRFHVGDLAWGYYQHSGREHEWRLRLWERAVGEPVGWAWLVLPGDGMLHALAEHRLELVPELAAWLEEQATEPLGINVLDRDEPTVQALRTAGYGPSDERPFNSMVLDLGGELPERALPEGFRTRHVEGEADLARRVAVHRATWSVFGPSRVTEESYRNVMAAWPYRPELDWVVEGPDGRFVASCLVWLDEENGVGELEPVGTDPAYWRRGFGFAVCAAALQALREHGADTAVVYSIEVPGKPSAPALYDSLGFETRGQHVTFRRDARPR